MEQTCILVSSRGLLYSCDIHHEFPTSSSSIIDPQLYLTPTPSHKDGASIYVCNSGLQEFVLRVLPCIDYKFVLVSGDADCSMPFDILSASEFQTLVSSDYLLHWYCQNALTADPRITPLPIGLDYHTLRAHIGMMHPWGPGAMPIAQESQLLGLRLGGLSLKERKLSCYCNFHHGVWGINTRGDRQELLATIDQSLVEFSSTFCNRETSWREAITCAFVLSPWGGGYDCHRTWEAIALGCIPIVRSSPLDRLFDGLPVLIIDSWSSITKELLVNTIEKYTDIQTLHEKLTLAHWKSEWEKLKLAAASSGLAAPLPT